MLKETMSDRLKKLKTTDIQGAISSIERLQGWLDAGLNISPQILKRLKQSTLITSSGASTRIEGAELSDEEVKKLLNGLKTSRLKDRDSQEVAGYADATLAVFDNYQDIKFSENTILHLHKVMLAYSDKDAAHRGKYKTSPNKVEAINHATGEHSLVFNPTEPYLTPVEMRDIVEWTNAEFQSGRFHPLLIIANFIIEFLAIHPFKDGNGRLSRVLTNLLLLQHGYCYVRYASLEKLVEENKERYYLVLRKGQKNRKTPKSDVSEWISFFLEMLLKQSELVKALAQGKDAGKLLSQKQEAIMKLFEESEEITKRLVVKKLKMPDISAIQALNRLLLLGMIEKLGAGRATRYVREDR